MSSIPTVFIDLETSGLGPGSEIIQLAAIAVDENFNELPYGTFEQKLQFDVNRAEREALEMNHYDAGVWEREALPAYAALNAFEIYLKPWAQCRTMSKKGRPYFVTRLAGFNIVNFDGPRLRSLFEQQAKFFPCDFKYRDVMQLGLWWADRQPVAMPDHKLGTFCARFGIDCGGKAHDAFTDVRNTVALAKRLMEELAA